MECGPYFVSRRDDEILVLQGAETAIHLLLWCTKHYSILSRTAVVIINSETPPGCSVKMVKYSWSLMICDGHHDTISLIRLPIDIRSRVKNSKPIKFVTHES